MTNARLWFVVLGLAVACKGDKGDGPRQQDSDTPSPTGTATATGTGTGSASGLTLWDLEATPVDGYPTVVEVSWAQSGDAAVHVEYSFDEGEWHSSPERQLSAGNHTDLLLGVPMSEKVVWRLISTDPDGVGQAWDGTRVTIPPPPDTLPVPMLLTHDPAGVDPSMPYVLVSVFESSSQASRSWTLMLDRQARVVWGHRSPPQRSTMHPRISWDQDALLVDHCSFWAASDRGVASEVVALKLDGSEVERWATPGQHHPYTDMPDGSLIYASYDITPGEPPLDDILKVIDPNGNETTLAGCRDALRALGDEDWCGSNTISYDPDRDVFLYSIFTHDAVVQLDRSGAVQQWYGNVPGAWTFSPPQAQFWYQHGAVFTDTGTLLVSSHARQDSGELVVREYELDSANQQLVEVWSAGEGLDVRGRQMGEAHRLPGGNTLHNYGTHAVLREFAPDGTVVWDVRWERQQYDGELEHAIGRSAPVLVDLYALAPPRR